MATREVWRCDRCDWWQRDTRPGGNLGQCKRFPPQVYADGRAGWPTTSDADWCAEFSGIPILEDDGEPEVTEA